MKMLLKEKDEQLCARIRIIILRQWMKIKSQVKSLVKYGCFIYEAVSLDYCKKGYMFIANSKILQKCYN